MKRKPTAFGWTCMFLMVWIPFAAIATSNNFLYMLFALLVGLMGASHVLAGHNLKKVTLTRRFPADIYARTPFTIHYAVQSDYGLGASTLDFAEHEFLRLEGAPVNIPRVPPGDPTIASGLFSLPRRGEVPIPEGKLASTFPFGLARYFRNAGGKDTVLVFPCVESLADEIPFDITGTGRGLERKDPFGSVCYLFRDYVPGDPYKRIDWKKSARCHKFITRELAEEGARELAIHLPGDPSERAISRAASLVVHYSCSGTPVSLHGPGMSVPPGSGREFCRKLLTILARWERLAGDVSSPQVDRGVLVEIDPAGEFSWSVDTCAEVQHADGSRYPP
ncbi:MAG: DUF58 domain-containing protein [Thermodesulfobacteriota bacterium]